MSETKLKSSLTSEYVLAVLPEWFVTEFFFPLNKLYLRIAFYFGKDNTMSRSTHWARRPAGQKTSDDCIQESFPGQKGSCPAFFFFFQKSVLLGDTFVSLLSIKDVFKMTFYHKAYKLIIVFGKQRNVCCEEVAGGLERWLEG